MRRVFFIILSWLVIVFFLLKNVSFWIFGKGGWFVLLKVLWVINYVYLLKGNLLIYIIKKEKKIYF